MTPLPSSIRLFPLNLLSITSSPSDAIDNNNPPARMVNADTVCENPNSSKDGGDIQGILVPHQFFRILFRRPPVVILVNLLDYLGNNNQYDNLRKAYLHYLSYLTMTNCWSMTPA